MGHQRSAYILPSLFLFPQRNCQVPQNQWQDVWVQLGDTSKKLASLVAPGDAGAGHILTFLELRRRHAPGDFVAVLGSAFVT